MALDIRLDFITNIDPLAIQEMTAIRKVFIEIDDQLASMADEAHEKNKPAAARAVALARTYNEQACQSAIKSLCILGERPKVDQPAA
jgi:hypothetical protein